MSSVSFHQQQCSLGLRGWTSPWLRESELDWLASRSLNMNKWFPEPNDAAALQSFRTVTIQRHQSSSVFLWHLWWSSGKRLIFNLCGHRFIMGMRFDSWLQKLLLNCSVLLPKLTTFQDFQGFRVQGHSSSPWQQPEENLTELWTEDKLFESFNATFGQNPENLGQMGAWLRQIPLTDIAEKGFFLTLKAGEVLIVPEFYMVMEACLGGRSWWVWLRHGIIPIFATISCCQMGEWGVVKRIRNWQLAVNNYFVWFVMFSIFLIVDFGPLILDLIKCIFSFEFPCRSAMIQWIF